MEYQERLRAALEARDWSQLELVRRLAARTGNAVESERSSVRGYLNGSRPSPPRARLLAEILEDPGLAQAGGSRQSRAERIDGRLARLEEEVGELLAGQREALVGQAELLVLIASIQETLGGLQLEPKKTRRHSQ